MSYVDQNNGREKSLSGIGSALLVAGIGYGLVTGLAMKVITVPDGPFVVHNYDPDTLPPPPPKPVPHADGKPAVATTAPATTIVRTPDLRSTTIDLTPVAGPVFPPLPPLPLGDGSAVGALTNQAIAARPRGTPGTWVTSDDYPAAALRSGEQGRTGFRLDIGADGHITACTVTQSSGSAELDQTACRMLMRRARFTPARDAAGMPIASDYANNVVWTLPSE
jgi:protein TonB